MAIRSYRDLDVWKAAVDMVEMTYQLTSKFPLDEKYGLKSQMQRAAVSIAANIAEGYGRTHRREYLNHLSIANGSLAEFETHLIIAKRIGFADKADAKNIWNQAKRSANSWSRWQTGLFLRDRPGRPDRPGKPERRLRIEQ